MCVCVCAASHTFGKQGLHTNSAVEEEEEEEGRCSY